MPPSPHRASLLPLSALACLHLQDALGYSNRAMATVAGCSVRQWIRWKVGKCLPWPTNLERLSVFARAAQIEDEFQGIIEQSRTPPLTPYPTSASVPAPTPIPVSEVS